jgi:hypothetical protein
LSSLMGVGITRCVKNRLQDSYRFSCSSGSTAMDQKQEFDQDFHHDRKSNARGTTSTHDTQGETAELSG